MLGRTLEILGEVLIGLVVIRVHGRVMREHKIDQVVFAEMRRERILGGIGIALIVVGYAIEVYGLLRLRL